MDKLDDALGAAAQATRAKAFDGLDLDNELAATLRRAVVDSVVDGSEATDRHLRVFLAVAAAVIAIVAGVAIASQHDDTIRTAASDISQPAIAPTTALEASSTTTTPAPANLVTTAPATTAGTDPAATVAEFVGALRQAARDGDYAMAAAMWTGYPYADSERLDRIIEFTASNQWLLDGELRFDVYDAWSFTPDAASWVVAVTRADWAGTAAFLISANGMVERIQLPEQTVARISADRTRLTVDAVPVEGGVAVYVGGVRLSDDAIVIDPTSTSLTVDLAGLATSDPLLVVVSAATAELPGALALIVAGTSDTGGDVVPCPTADVDESKTADLDGDRTVETVIVVHPADSPEYSVSVCGSTLVVNTAVFESANKPLIVDPFDADGDGADELWIGGSSGGGICVTLHRLDGTVLERLDLTGCFGGPSQGLGCETVDGVSQLVAYDYRFVGGTFIDDSTSMVVTTRIALDGRPLGDRVLILPEQADEAREIVALRCNDQPIIG